MKTTEVTSPEAQQGKISLFDKVRQSCMQVAKEAKYVHIVQENLNKFLQQHTPLLMEFVKKKKIAGSYPISFDNDIQEVSFHVLYAALQFGSGFRHLLHKYCGRGASLVMTYGMLSMILSSNNLDAMSISAITLHDVENYFKIPTKVDVPVKENSPIKVEKDSELKPLAEKIRFVFNECGRVLRGLQCHKGFGEFVQNVLEENNSPEYLVEQLVKYFPSIFNDVAQLKSGEMVYFLKKAQLVVGELYKHFSQRETAESNLAKLLSKWTRDDISKLTVFVDNVIPAVLIKEGVLKLEHELEQIIHNRDTIPAGSIKEIELRAVALHSCELIVEKSNNTFNAFELDYYLWNLGKEEAYRSFERHATIDTIFY